MVIAIIAILAAILFPVFAKAREKARQSSCTSNLKQLSLGFTQYVQDYDEVLPGDGQYAYPVYGSWVPGGRNLWAAPATACDVARGATYPYVKNAQVYSCPSDQWAPTVALSYGMNYNCAWRSIAAVQSPASLVLLVEEQGCDDGAAGSGPFRACHGEGHVLAYLDGHAKWTGRDIIPAANWVP